MAAEHVRWTRLALGDLNGAKSWLEGESPQAWEKLRVQITAALERLQHNPLLGKIVREREVQGYRELVLPPYRLVYAIAGRELHVLRLWHARRDPTQL